MLLRCNAALQPPTAQAAILWRATSVWSAIERYVGCAAAPPVYPTRVAVTPSMRENLTRQEESLLCGSMRHTHVRRPWPACGPMQYA